VDVFGEVRRCLKPGAPFIVSYSNRCFPTKAVAIWRALDIKGHAGLIRTYLDRSGFSAIEMRLLVDGSSSDPLIAVIGHG